MSKNYRWRAYREAPLVHLEGSGNVICLDVDHGKGT